MAGGKGHSFADLTLHAPKRWQVLTGQGMCAIMWLWVLYRAKNDGAVLLGLRHPWEGHGHGHGNTHGKEHGHEKGDLSMFASEVKHKPPRLYNGASKSSDGYQADPGDMPKLRGDLEHHEPVKAVPMPINLLKPMETLERHPKVVSLIEEDN